VGKEKINMKNPWWQLIYIIISLGLLAAGGYFLIWKNNIPEAALYIAFSALAYGYYLNEKTRK
jgi:hypothetical protein